MVFPIESCFRSFLDEDENRTENGCQNEFQNQSKSRISRLDGHQKPENGDRDRENEARSQKTEARRRNADTARRKVVSWWPVSGAGPAGIQRPACQIPGYPGRPLTQIYPLRARRRPRRVRGSRFVSLYVAVCMCLSFLLPDPGVLRGSGKIRQRASLFQLFFRVVFLKVF